MILLACSALGHVHSHSWGEGGRVGGLCVVLTAIIIFWTCCFGSACALTAIIIFEVQLQTPKTSNLQLPNPNSPSTLTPWVRERQLEVWGQLEVFLTAIITSGSGFAGPACALRAIIISETRHRNLQPPTPRPHPTQNE